MKPPKCKLCEKAHWPYEEHDTLEEVRKLGADVLGKVMPADPARGIPRADVQLGGMGRDFRMSPPANKRTEPINGQNKRTRGRPRKWASEAERKRAYRSRK